MRSRPILQFEVDIKKFKKGKRITNGGFGVVYSVEETQTGQKYAAKLIDCGDSQERCQQVINREIDIMLTVNHPTIVPFIGYSKTDFQDENNPIILMKLAQNGSLFDILKQIQQSTGPQNYSNTARQIILIGIARGMKYLHDRNIIHRDLKPGNILLDENLHPLITDFGLSKMFDVGHSKSQTQFGGTLPYMAPEVIKGDDYDRKADVYSFAIIMFEVVTDSTPYPLLESGKMTEYEFRKNVLKKSYRPEFTFSVKPPIRNLIEQCWSRDPSDRPSFKEILVKLSNFSLDDDDDCILDDVEVDEINQYIESIDEVSDPLEEALKRNEMLEIENQELKDENYSMKQKISSLLKELELLKNPTKVDDSKPEFESSESISSEAKNTKKIDQKTIKTKKVEFKKVDLKKVDVKTVKVKDFNESPLQTQQAIISKYADLNLNDINNLISFLLQFDELKNQRCLEISSMNDNSDDELLKDVISKSLIVIQSKATEFLFKNKPFKYSEVVNILKNFEVFSIQINYPSPSFQVVYDNVIDFRKIETNRLHFIITVFITGISETDQKFHNDKNVNFVIFDDSVSLIKGELNHGSFEGCLKLARITIPPSVSEIGSHSFCYCSSLTRVTIPSSVRKISSNAFNGCSSLFQVKFGPSSSLAKICDGAFSGCSSLKEISLPMTVTEIESNAFSYCSSLKKIELFNISEIKEFTFRECSSLTEVIIPSSVVCICDSAFYCCTMLSNVTIPNSVTTIGNNSFYYCSSLLNVTLPSSLKVIGKCAFDGCSLLATIKIPDSVADLGSSAFYGCSSLKEITIPSSVSKIESVFIGCSSLINVTIPSSVLEIGNWAFSRCSSLKEIQIPSSVNVIGQYAFDGCSSLVKINIPSSVAEIGYSTFSGCSSLKEISIPSSVTKIGEYTFYDCSSLEKIVIPPSVTQIGEYAFCECSSLNQINIPPSVTEIGENAFFKCSSLVQISIPSSLKVDDIGLGSNVKLLFK
ncbi:hypothetical protein M9Y10_032699 [Tritrichomonas musculus]|uniref:Protein kinase domain-containing protein n=1 Tax=Tritrichomonas musculus TaxID=1915356 RepID=A0ABR2GYM9_9EUKA